MYLWLVIAVCVGTVQSQDGCKVPAIINASEGVVQSPFYDYFPAFSYPVNLKCRWTVNVPVGQNIRVTFSPAFAIEGTSGRPCDYDYVTFYDPGRGNNFQVCSKLVQYVIHGPFCGQQVPSSFVVGISSVVIEFCTDISQNGHGFEVTFNATSEPATPITTTPATTPPTTVSTITTTTTVGSTVTVPLAIISCSENITLSAANSEVFIESPNYPQPYPNDVNCVWIVTDPDMQLLQINAEEFNIEFSATCSYDVLQLTDLTVNEELGKYCGASGPNRLRSKGNTVQIVFKTDFSNTNKGFRISIKKSPCQQYQQACPNDPNSETCFSPSMLCDGKIDCPGGQDENCPPGCGIPERKPHISARNSRIIGGIEALPHSWPWQVTIFDTKLPSINAGCGGSIIDHHWVLTAATCCEPFSPGIKSEFFVVVGEHDLNRKIEPHAISYMVEKLIFHPRFISQQPIFSALPNINFCLMKTKMPMFFNSDVTPVCLPSRSTIPPGTRCYVTGFGNDYEPAVADSPNTRQVLRQIDVEVADQSYCRNQTFNFKPIHPEYICSIPDPDKSPNCYVDQGGPLVCQSADDPNRWEIVGVQSFNRCNPNIARTPNVFARTAVVLDWIAETVIRN